MATLTELFDNVIDTHRKHQKAIHVLKEKLKPYIDFPFFVQYFESDGFVVLSEDQGLNISVASIIALIRDKEKITQEYFYLYGQ